MKALITIILASAALPSLSQTIVNPVRTMVGYARQGNDIAEFSVVDSQVIYGRELRTIPGLVKIDSEFRPVSTTVGDWLFETNSALTIYSQGTAVSQILTRFSGVLELSAPTLVSLDFTTTTWGGGVAAFALGNVFYSTTSASFQGVLGPGSYVFELSGDIPAGSYPNAGMYAGAGRVHMTTQAVPEPSTLAVLGLSSAILAVRRRRRARL